MTFCDELNNFKRHINLTQFAATYGYMRDQGRSSVSSCNMRHDNGNRIIVTQRGDYWVYVSIHSDHDGTIIDFVQQHDSLNLGQVRSLLRKFSGSSVAIPAKYWQREAKGSVKDVNAVKLVLSRHKPLIQSDYLEGRCVAPDTLKDPVFAGRILKGFDGAVIFPHYDNDGICGYEVKKCGFTSFSKNGSKSIWSSNAPVDCKTIVVCESVIDCLSYHGLYLLESALYISPGGTWSKKASSLIQEIFLSHNNCNVIAAMDNDNSGIYQAGLIADIARNSASRSFRVHIPDIVGADWNDVLKAEDRPPMLCE